MKNLILQQVVMMTEEIDAISRLGDIEEPEIGKGLKIMTPRQMIIRLPVLLAQKKLVIIVKN